MSDAKWTPGPWTHRKEDGPYLSTLVGGGEIVAVFKRPISEANANLITAAPDLYYALSAIMIDLPSNKDWLDPAIEKTALFALAKARGKS